MADHAAMPQADCSSCNGTCPHPEACHLPERPSASVPYDLDGPYLPRTRAGWARAALAAIGIAGCSLVIGVVGRLAGIL